MLQRLDHQPAEARRSAAAERQRRCRKRQRDRVALYQVEVDATVIDMLVRCFWLHDGDAKDRRKVSAAISRCLLDAADDTE